MELSPTDLLDLPREAALPLLGKMGKELRHARQVGFAVLM